MQTSFSLASLADPAMQASEKILRTCVHCGFCTATCPTYLLLGDERDSPRGRIYLIKDMFENAKPASEEVVRHIDRCLSCLSCMTTCPSGVHYMHLVDHARSHIEETYKRPLHDRLMRALLAKILPFPWRFRLALLAAYFGKLFRPLLKLMPGLGPRLVSMLDLAPARIPARSSREGPGTYPAAGPRKARVALLAGCAQTVLAPGINEAAIRLLNRLGVEVVIPKGESCCGALVHHMGRSAESHDQAKKQIDAWISEIDAAGLDAIVVTASGCGTTIKDYAFMFRDDPAYAAKAKKISALTRDIVEFLARLELPASHAKGFRVAYHSACSLQHGQQIKDEPKKLLSRLGFTVTDVPEGHICCGSAGTYNMLQPELSAQLRARKVANIAKVAPQIIATGNLGCITQISLGLSQAGQATPILHTVELVDWALGGPVPDAIAASGLDRLD